MRTRTTQWMWCGLNLMPGMPVAPVALAAVLLVGLVGLVGCRTTTSDEDIVSLDYQRVRALMADAEGNERLVLLDVRSARSYQQGHIPGAINIPMPEIQRRDPRLADADRIIVYGIDGQSGLSPAATKKLISLGYRNVYEFRSGFEGWRREGGEVVQPEG